MQQNIIILFGGSSDERLVSTASAQFMAQAISPSEIWFWGLNNKIYSSTKEDLLSHENPFTCEFKPKETPIASSIEEALDLRREKMMVFLLAVHGGKGENGFLQSLFTERGLFFTGSSPQGSKMAFDKVLAKNELKKHGVRVAEGIVLDRPSESKEKIIKFFNEYKECILKPIQGGSSLGVKFVKNEDDLKEALFYIEKISEPYLLEKIIKGREITIGVIETENGPMALPATEIELQKGRDFDYEGKYLGQGSKETTPADLNQEKTHECQKLAIAAHVALGLYGYSRTDMILDDRGPVFLEVNTLPGLSRSSLIPQALAHAQITMRQFLLTQIEMAKKR